jgi:hypothetical protein
MHHRTRRAPAAVSVLERVGDLRRHEHGDRQRQAPAGHGAEERAKVHPMDELERQVPRPTVLPKVDDRGDVPMR